MKTTTLPLRNLMNRSPVRAFFLIPFALACFALSPQARAVCQQGCDTFVLNNTFLGEEAFISNTTGFYNTAIGALALHGNTQGGFNTATGAQALVNNRTGNDNTAIGFNALFTTRTGFNNTAVGKQALQDNTTGFNNTANGNEALLGNTTGSFNTATGASALLLNTTGSNNIALGFQAGMNRTTGSNNIDIGNSGVAAESNTIRIGTSGRQTGILIAGISGVTVPGGVGVIVGTNGHLGTTTSSARFKDAIKPMDKASEAILALKPVIFRYKHDLDPAGIAQFGLVAEEVEKVNPALVARDDRGKPYTVRYDAVNAMLLNEFLKEHRKVEQLKKDFECKIAAQQKQIEALTAGLREQAAQIQKVNDQLAATQLVTRLATNE